MDLFAYLIAFLKRKDINRTRKKMKKTDTISLKRKRKEKKREFMLIRGHVLIYSYIFKRTSSQSQ